MLSLLILALLLPADNVAAAEPPETDAGIVAAAVRERGFTCERPQSVERDAASSEADRPGWIIRCETDRYRVTFEGDTGPRVTPLD